ncbi:uncharacterized protein C8orf34 homolog isoform X2 [Anneissia japonica]|uniref:uncharacterized protein C8orf34 homolog isoform X2 n=1 Tax=Anneissia japonica TaxID=1529436 RepID=UPI00142552D8|nr:uncharacterized protein C8orf34 homolog isoform X2 [Anneissia japonica]
MAASQYKVQAFLEKHRIGGLFEDLMSRLIKELPSEPIPYLIKVLNRMDQQRQQKQENPLTSSSTRMRPMTSLPAGRRSVGGNVDQLSHSADAKTLWASTDSALKKSDRGYDKPWSSNMKKPKQKSVKEDAIEGKKTQKPEWDSKVRKSTGDFDELFQESQKTKSKSVAFSKGVSGPAQWVTDDSDDLKYTSSEYTRRKVTSDDDPLSGELTTDKLEKKYGHLSSQDESLPIKGRMISSTKRSFAHKEEIAQLARQQVSRNGYIDAGEDSMNADDGDFDEAADMLEDVAALRSEGVANAKSVGHKLSRRQRSEPEAKVKISICSRCARLAGAENGSEYGGRSNPYQSLESMSDYVDSQSGGFQRQMTDDEFESVSQVEGPRYPVWESDEVRLSSKSPKTKNKYRTSGRESPISDVIETPHTSLGWESMTQRSETEAAYRESDVAARGRSWHRASSDDDSSFDWNTDRKGNSTRFTKSDRPPSGL